MQFFELFLTLDLVQTFDLKFTDPVKFVLLRIGDQPTSSLNPCGRVLTWSGPPGSGFCGGGSASLSLSASVIEISQHTFTRVRRYKKKTLYSRTLLWNWRNAFRHIVSVDHPKQLYEIGKIFRSCLIEWRNGNSKRLSNILKATQPMGFARLNSATASHLNHQSSERACREVRAGVDVHRGWHSSLKDECYKQRWRGLTMFGDGQ